MSPIVRFAPSPTGRLHVGNVRTALINWLFARGAGGRFLLRIDDTDTDRSTDAFEAAIKEDLKWLGLVWDDTFNQSHRFAEYDAAAERLRAAGRLYPCYETAEELERKRKIALSRGRPPVYDRAALNLDASARQALEAEGRHPHWRFRLSGERVGWRDLVRGDQTVDTASVSDPVLIREDGSYLYTLPSVVDDIAYGITHVVRGEDHVTNSGAQIEIFQALGAEPPEMAHMPLLVGADGQGLSKRLGSLSMHELSRRGIEPLAVASLLARIGTSDNVEAAESLDALAQGFDFAKIGRAPARFDEGELTALNAAIVHAMPHEAVRERLSMRLGKAADDPLFWETVRANCDTVDDAADWLEVAFGEVEPLVDDEDDRAFLREAAAHLPEGPVTGETWAAWTQALKTATGRKGKSLFMPLRKALTGRAHGPDMGSMLRLIGRERALARLAKV